MSRLEIRFPMRDIAACFVLVWTLISQPSLAFDAGWPSTATRRSATDASDAGMLRLIGGDIYRGAMVQTIHSDRLAWQSPSFLAPVEFPWKSVERFQSYATLPPDPLPDQAYCIEMHSGQVLSGQLLGFEANTLRLSVPDLGERKLPINSIRNVLRIYPTAEQPLQILKSDAWEQVLPSTRNGRATKWYLKAGEISTDTSGTTISQWGFLSELSTIDIDVSWDQPSVNWWLTIGEPRRIELQVRKLQNKELLNITLLVENSKDADVLSVQLPYPTDSSLHLKLLCDANKGAYVLLHDERVLGELKGNPDERIIGRTKVSFTNTAIGVLTLSDLRISSRPFASPAPAVENQTSMPEVKTRNRGTYFGSVDASDDPSEFRVIGSDSSITRIAYDELERIEFPAQSNPPSDAHATLRMVRFELANGMHFATDRIASEPGPTKADIANGSQNNTPALLLIFDDQTLRISTSSILSITSPSLEPTSPLVDSVTPSSSFQLLTNHAVSVGKVDSVVVSETGQRTLAWMPRHAIAAVPINPTSDGTIEPIRAPMAMTERRVISPGPLATIRADTANKLSPLIRPLLEDEPSLFLVSGDCFPARVLSGDRDIVRFSSPFFQQTEIPANMVRGIRVVEMAGNAVGDKQVLSRLLTLPRVQRKNPPTHALIARDTDMVRGQLISFDRDEVVMELRGEARTFLMKNISEIIRLEAAPSLTEDASQASSETGEATKNDGLDLYQIVLNKGSRVSLAPEAVTAESLLGIHPFLGRCELPWTEVEQMILGDAIRVDAARSRFGKWKLQNAIDPKYIQEGDASESDAPTDTPQDRLVGRTAPEFDLPRIDGTPCRLADYQGRVLVLDFWASWCGPCIQGMPRVLDISREYRDLGVELLFINLEEDEDRVREFLRKLEITPTVALDIDGSVARQYAVQAIPQTVVIDRDGTIRKVLVGASPDNEQELLRVLDELTARIPKP